MVRSGALVLLYAVTSYLGSTLALPLQYPTGAAVTFPSSSGFGSSHFRPACPHNALCIRQTDVEEDYVRWLHNLSNEELGAILSKSGGDVKNHEQLLGELYRRFSDIIKKAQKDGLDEEQMMKLIFGNDYSFRPDY